jgi:hypothetical protein
MIAACERMWKKWEYLDMVGGVEDLPKHHGIYEF